MASAQQHRDASATADDEVSASTRSTSPKAKRASVACTRCRRYRQKCVMTWLHGKPKTPCDSCQKHGREIEAQCIIVPRGHSAQDRSFRRRTNAAQLSPPYSTEQGPSRSIPAPEQDLSIVSSTYTDSMRGHEMPTPDQGNATVSPATVMSRDKMDMPSEPMVSSSDLLPPHAEVVEGVRNFLFSYFQLGFLPRAFFLEQVQNNIQGISVFLLLAILTLAARFSGGLIRRFGGRQAASAELRRRALSLLGEEMISASVERMQGLFLLGVSEFGEGNGGRSWLFTGIAIRMAATLQLHRESSYALTPHATPEDRIRSESARRSFWLVYCHDQQIAGRSPSTTFPMSSIDVRLPASEDDFIFGIEPFTRSCLPGTMGPPVYGDEPERSLFATMIIGQSLWARTAELACGQADPKPWEDGQFSRLDRELRSWEDHLPPRHVYNDFTLKVMKTQHLDLGYVSISMLLRLSFIVLRRAYLPTMISYMDNPKNSATGAPNDLETPAGFWPQMSSRMVEDCVGLHKIIQACLTTRPAMEGFPAVFIFAVYMCGDVAYHLCRWPELCLEHCDKGQQILQTALSTLELLDEAWPLATRWKNTLDQQVGGPGGRSDSRRQSALNAAGREQNDVFAASSTFDTMSTQLDSSGPDSRLAALSSIAANHSTIDPMLTLSRSPNMGTPAILDSTNRPELPERDSSGSDTLQATFDLDTLFGSGDTMFPSSADYFQGDLTAFLRGESVD